MPFIVVLQRRHGRARARLRAGGGRAGAASAGGRGGRGDGRRDAAAREDRDHRMAAGENRGTAFIPNPFESEMYFESARLCAFN